MKTFATVDDLSERWRTLTSDEAARAQVLLEDASAMIESEIDGVVLFNKNNEAQVRIFTSVCCAMVKRVLAADVESPAYTQTSMSAGGYSQSFTLANPNADLYITKAERKKLGLGKMRIMSIAPKIGG